MHSWLVLGLRWKAGDEQGEPGKRCGWVDGTPLPDPWSKVEEPAFPGREYYSVRSTLGEDHFLGERSRPLSFIITLKIKSNLN